MLQAEVAAARQLVFHAAERDAAGEDCVKDVSMAKALCGELVNKVMYTCQQFHGGFWIYARNGHRAHGARCAGAGPSAVAPRK